MGSHEKKIKKTENMKEYMKLYMREYMAKYIKNNPEKYYSYKICNLCGNEYMINNKTNHLKTKNHKIGLLQKQLDTINN